MRQEKVHAGVGLEPVEVHCHGYCCNDQCHPEHGILFEFPSQPKNKWPEDVELFFNPQTPEME